MKNKLFKYNKMSAKINLKTTGIRGGSPSWNENKGAISVFIDHSNTNPYSSIISVDAFEGYGENYKRRDCSFVEIQSEGKMLFSGTFDELKNKLL